MPNRSCRALLIVAFILMTLICTLAADAAVFLVDSRSTAAVPDGQSWPSAYSSIQQAINAAVNGGASQENPAQIWVAAGAYTGSSNPIVTMRAWVSVYGGFTGTETTLDERNWFVNVTIIDGEDVRRCVTGSVNAVLDGFMLTKGYTTDRGGGMYGGTATNCTFTGNTAHVGGGMYQGTAANCAFTENTVTGDQSACGGAMYHGTATSCTFTRNMANLGYGNAHGGAMYYGTATNCTFTENSATGGPNGGQAYGGATHYSTATNCTFIGNMVTAGNADGGGMNYGTATHCTFTENTATGIAAHGGGMYYGTATDCTFSKNVSSGRDGSGGGKYYGTATNCTFAENTAVKGGGMYSGTAMNCTFTRNTSSDSAYGGGMYQGKATNCVFWQNSVREVTSMYWVTYSCVMGGYAGDGNIDVDPKFVDADNGALWLSPTSPCLNFGTAEGAPAADIRGVTRPQGVGVDMGAYEMEPAMATAPNVVGRNQADAETAILAAGLTVGVVTEEYSNSVAEGLVISQSPVSGASVAPSSAVSIVISLGRLAADVDDNGAANSVDIQLTINTALGLLDTVDCDIDGDGDIDATDVQLVINATLGL